MTQRQRGTETQKHRDTETKKHRETKTQSLDGTKIQILKDIEQRHKDIKTVSKDIKHNQLSNSVAKTFQHKSTKSSYFASPVR